MDEEELRTHFDEQWSFLRTSMREYDSGEWHEAKRIASTLRTLMHDTKSSTSLFQQLEIKDRLKLVNSGAGVDPNNLMRSTSSLTTMGPDLRNPANGMTFYPRPFAMMLASGRITELPFSEWWNMHVVKDVENRVFSRRQLVLLLANKDGGSHVDKLTNNERALKSGKHFGWQLDTESGPVPVELAPVPPSVRTIAMEVDYMLANQAAELGLTPREVYVDPYDN